MTAIGNRDLAGVSAYAVNVAEERFKAGFDISEVQAAFNAIEEAMWRQIVESAAPEDLAEATGLMNTVLGFGKDVLARTYVSLASRRHVRSLDLSAMFAGTQARPEQTEHMLPTPRPGLVGPPRQKHPFHLVHPARAATTAPHVGQSRRARARVPSVDPDRTSRPARRGDPAW